MRKILKMALVALALTVSALAHAQSQGYDVFVPIAKYIGQGDAEALSAWMDDTLEISVVDNTSSSSKNQAKQILKSFFSKSTPTAFRIDHTAARANVKYAIGTLNCGAENYIVTILVSYKNESYKIQQIKVEKAK